MRLYAYALFTFLLIVPLTITDAQHQRFEALEYSQELPGVHQVGQLVSALELQGGQSRPARDDREAEGSRGKEPQPEGRAKARAPKLAGKEGPEPHGERGTEAEGEGEETNKAVNIAVAIMLFGSIAFQMSLFYLVNHPDYDMRKYSWETISSTISIFCSVLIFKGVDGIVDWYLLGEERTRMKVLGDFVHFGFWLLLLQLAIFFLSGAHMDDEDECPGELSPLSRVTGRSMAQSVNHAIMQYLHHNAKACALILAHVTGFASINAFGAMQQLPFFAASPLRTFSVVVIAFLSLVLFMQVTDEIREWRAMIDGKKTRQEEMWDEEVVEAEDDVVGLTISFLTVQVIRFAIASELPDQNGESGYIPTHFQSFLLLLAAVASVACVVLLGPLRVRLHHHEKGTAKQRAVAGLHVISSMCFAWSLLYAIRWEIAKLDVSHLGEGVIASVILALVVSAVSFVLIFFLDMLADLDSTGEDVDEAIITVILSFGIMVGFSWEQCFDAGIETISEEALKEGAHQQWGKFLMALVLASVVLPAWRRYILPMVHGHHRHEEGSPAPSPLRHPPHGGHGAHPHEATPLVAAHPHA